MEERKKNRKKTAQSLLLLMQRGSFKSKKSEFLRQKSSEGKQSSSPAISLTKYCEADVPPYCLDKSLPDLSSLSSSEHSKTTWQDRMNSLRRMSSNISQLSPSELDRRPSWSSSYTSWTRPVAGQDNTDSFGPASDILDKDDEDDKIADDVIIHRRRSSADTCNDIDDIEDFELDPLYDCDITEDNDKVFIEDEVIDKGKSEILKESFPYPDVPGGSINKPLDKKC